MGKPDIVETVGVADPPQTPGEIVATTMREDSAAEKRARRVELLGVFFEGYTELRKAATIIRAVGLENEDILLPGERDEVRKAAEALNATAVAMHDLCDFLDKD